MPTDTRKPERSTMQKVTQNPGSVSEPYTLSLARSFFKWIQRSGDAIFGQLLLTRDCGAPAVDDRSPAPEMLLLSGPLACRL